MSTLCLFGGGRWSRVLLSVLTTEFPDLSIIWITKNNYTNNCEWLKTQHNISDVKIVRDEEEAWASNPQAVLVATASHSHLKYTREALLRKIPVLSEKPFCFSVTEAEELISLSKQFNIAVGVNFEFMYASYLHSFAQYLTGLNITSITVEWQDAFCETRYGEQKIGDLYTPIMYDSFQHCWSLLKYLFPHDSLIINSVHYDLDSSIAIDANLLSKRVTIVLSRRATKRVRRISVNNDSLILDFSVEPGEVTVDGNTIKNVWHGNRPLRAMFDSFFAAIQNSKLQWPLSISHCLEVVHLSAQASELLEQSQLSCLANRKPFTIDDVITRNLLVDIFLPKITATGEYFRAHNLQEQMDFSDHVIRRFL